MDRYIQYGEIGRGSASAVYKGRKKGSIEYVAICSMDKARRARAENEAAVLRTLSHPNVIRYYEYHVTTNHLWKVVEFCSGGDLATVIAQDERLPEATVRSFGRDIASGLQYVHSMGVLLRDLKPSNILVDGQSGRLLLSDFGIASDVRSDSAPSRACGSPCYLAPELCRQDAPPTHSRASDMWALGCVLYEMAAGAPPFVSESLPELRAKIASGQADYPAAIFKPPLRTLVASLIEKSAAARANWAGIRASAVWPAPLEALDTAIVDHHFERMADSLGAVGRAPPSATASEFAAAAGGSNAGSDDDERGDRPFTRESAQASAHGGDGGDEEAEEEGEVEEGESHMVPRGERFAEESPSSRKIVAWNNDVSARLGTPGDMARATVVLARTPSAAPDLIFHASDSAVDEIASAVGGGTPPAKLERLMPVKPYTPSKLSHEAPDKVYAHLSEIVRAIDSSQPRAALACLAYLERLAGTEESANVLANTVARALVARLRPSQGAAAGSVELRTRACRVLALCFRHATRIGDGFDAPDAFACLGDVVRSAATPKDLLRQALAALGELLFYCASVVTCTVGADDEAPVEPPEIPASAISAILRRVSDPDDESLQLAALRTVANVAAVPGEHMRRVCTGETALALWKAFSSTKNGEVRAASASALSRLVRFSVGIGQHLVDKVGTRAIATGLADGGARVRQAFLNILNVLLRDSGDGGSLRRAQNLLLEDHAIAKGVLSVLSTAGANEVLRGKAMLAAGQMARHSKDALLLLCGDRLIPLVDKDARSLGQRPASAHGPRTPARDDAAGPDGSFNAVVPPSPSVAVTDPYAARCLEFLLRTLARTAPTILDAVRTGLSALAERKYATVAQAKSLRLALRHFPVVVHLMASAALRARMVDGLLLEDLQALLTLVAQLATPTDRMAPVGQSAWTDCAEHTLAIAEAVCQHTAVLLGHYSALVQRVLPALAEVLDCPSEPVRIQAARLIACVVATYTHQPALFDPASEVAPVKASTRLLNNTLVKDILVRVPALLGDVDPIPSIALRLLHSVVLRAPAYISIFQRIGLVPLIAARMAEPDAGVAVVGLLRTLLGAPPEDVDRRAVVDSGALGGLARALGAIARVSSDGRSIALHPAPGHAGSGESLRDLLLLAPELLGAAMAVASTSPDAAHAGISASRELAAVALPRALEVLAVCVPRPGARPGSQSGAQPGARPDTASNAAFEDAAVLARACADVVLHVANTHAEMHGEILGEDGQAALAHALTTSDDRRVRTALLSAVERVCEQSPHLSRLLVDRSAGGGASANALLAAVQSRAGGR